MHQVALEVKEDAIPLLPALHELGRGFFWKGCNGSEVMIQMVYCRNSHLLQ
jgi:hypothetical protein